MNYSIFLVKIVEAPEQSFFEDETSVTEFKVQFPSLLTKNYTDIFHVSVWGTLAHDVAQYYSVDDYLIIEGYLSLREDHSNNFTVQKDKQIEFTAIKLYPFFLTSQKSN